MGPQPSPCDIEAVKQRGECRTEEPVAQEICGKIHQYGRIYIHEPGLDEKMYRVIGGQYQQSPSHDAAGTDIVVEDGLVRSLRRKEIGREEKHQHQGSAKRQFI